MRSFPIPRIPSPIRRVASFALLGAAVGLGGCRSAGPPTRPLDPARRVATLAAAREEVPAPQGSVDLDTLKALLRANHPGVRAARAAALARRRGAAEPSRPANPSVSIGPLLLGGVDVLSSAAWGVEAALGWVAPLTPARRLDDRARRLDATAGWIEAVATERRAWLDARAALATARSAIERRAARAAAAGAAEERLAIARRAADAGESDAVSVALLDVEAAGARRARHVADDAASAAREALASALGLRANALDAATLPAPALDLEPPPLERLVAELARSRSDVAVLVARYEAAEARLRTEVARGQPDLEFEASVEREDGENRFGLLPSIEVPVFDQNQVGIATACAERDALRAELDGMLGTALGEVEIAWRRLDAARRRVAQLEEDLVPSVAALVAASEARREAAGSIDALSHLETLRAEQELLVERADARADVLEAWSELETAAGAPLLAWAHDDEEMTK